MRGLFALAGVVALMALAPQATGASPATGSPQLSALAVSAAVVLDEEETCEQRGHRQVCIPRCSGLPLGLVGMWAGLDEAPNQGQCYTHCMNEVVAACRRAGG